METSTVRDHALTTNQKWTIASTSAGFALENMDVLFLSFALSSIIADLHINGAAAGLISSITNLGMLAGGILFGLIATVLAGCGPSPTPFSFLLSPLLPCILLATSLWFTSSASSPALGWWGIRRWDYADC